MNSNIAVFDASPLIIFDKIEYFAVPRELFQQIAVSTEPARLIGVTDELGPFRTDAKGMTVYLFTKDVTAGESACYDEAWPPVPVADGMTLSPGIPGTLGAIERTDGSRQMTYNDIPLYYYAADTRPGDTTGQDVGEVWYIIPPGMQLGDEPHHGSEEGHQMGEEVTSATPTSS